MLNFHIVFIFISTILILASSGEESQANFAPLTNSSIIAHVGELLQRYASSKNLTIQNVLRETKEDGVLEFLQSSQLARLDTIRQDNLARTRCAWIEFEDSKMIEFIKQEEKNTELQ